jgi:hypothetical protein
MMRAILMAAVLSASPALAGNVCLRSGDIARTSVPDARTILFHMKDGRVWRNTLMAACPELKFNGFIYDASPIGEICGNQQVIRVIHSGAVCMLGPFTPVAPTPAPAP